MSDKTKKLFVGIDGGATSSKLVLIDETESILAKASSGSCNKNNIGFETASKNVFDGINLLLQFSKQKKEDICGICITTAGCTMPSDKEQWKNAISKKYLSANMKVMIEVHNDSVGDVASVSPKEMTGIVCIVGTGSIVCGYKGDPNIEYRAGGWGPLLGDAHSAYHIGEKVLKSAALYYDICGDAHKRFTKTDDKKVNDDQTQNDNDNEKENDTLQKFLRTNNASKVLYECVMEHASITDFPKMVEWAYEEGDKYARIAACAMVALENYQKCYVAKVIIDKAIDELILRVLLVLNRMYPKQEFFQNKERKNINIIRAGSVLLKSEIFCNLFQSRLMWKLGGDGRQPYLRFIKPEREAQLGSALYIKYKYDSS